nr:MAG TPA: hypothetical protein [Caudoviricetes sp.]
MSIFSKLTIFKISLLLNSALLFNLALKVEPAMPSLEQKFNSVPNTSFILPLNLLLSNSIKSTSFLFRILRNNYNLSFFESQDLFSVFTIFFYFI